MKTNDRTTDKPYAQRYPAFVYSVLNACIPGTIYTESMDGQIHTLIDIPTPFDLPKITSASLYDVDRPIWAETPSGLYYAGGCCPSESFSHIVHERCLDRMRTGERFTLFSGEPLWDEMAADLPAPLRQLTRQAMNYPSTAMLDTRRQMPDGYELQKINASVIQKSAVFDEKYYIAYWQSLANYMIHGLGYAILYENQVVCECTSIFANAWTAEMDIYTVSEHRGKGLAVIAAAAFIKECLQTARQPVWECGTDNQASFQLAFRLGFVPAYTYSVWAR
ncbi:GNAT family N-acetyltransferase [Paenibacillus wulumuqiensis]|uniref:GNAT family N-acetyltransferase n=1 Tax=Paenibacillus wulumuqiensis TaxID=1567107 RepID=UPI000619B3C4|nr:GNAT family N-acetyltransferase [Paenibacillus wulumuqiensis]